MAISCVVCLAALGCAFQGFAQSLKPGQVSVRAETQVVQESVLQLRGKVEITTNSVLIRADEATFNVVTGDIEARGNVTAIKVGARATKPVLVVNKVQMNIHKPTVAISVPPL